MAKTGNIGLALQAAQMIQDAYDRSRAISDVAQTLITSGRTEDTCQVIDKALFAVQEIGFQLPAFRAEAMISITKSLLGSNLGDKIRSISIQTRDTVEKIRDDEDLSHYRRQVAEILAQLHSYRDARETANQCSRSSDRLAAYTAILREYHIERNPSLAKSFEEKE